MFLVQIVGFCDFYGDEGEDARVTLRECKTKREAERMVEKLLYDSGGRSKIKDIHGRHIFRYCYDWDLDIKEVKR